MGYPYPYFCLCAFWGPYINPTCAPRILPSLGRASGHFIFSLIGLKRILFTDIVQRL